MFSETSIIFSKMNSVSAILFCVTSLATKLFKLLLLITIMASASSVPSLDPNGGLALVQKESLGQAKQILRRTPIIDGHCDFSSNLRDLIFNDLRRFNFKSDLTKIEPWASWPKSMTDLPRLRKGMVGGQFWVVHTNCKTNYKDSVAQTIESFDAIKRLIQDYSDDLEFATKASDFEEIIAKGKIASWIGVEGGHSIQSSAGILRILYELGARYLTLTHNCNVPWADNNRVDAALNPHQKTSNGLSEFGLEIIDEMNRLGMMVDLSHVSMETMKQALGRSKAPVIFSHSSAKTICNHQRNVPDDVLHLVKQNGGLVMVNFFNDFIQCNKSKNATIWNVVEHIQYIKNLIGVEHVGIGADYDGVPKVPQGLEDVSKYPNLIAALLSTGNWTEDEIEKLSGRNLIRVFKQVENVRDSLRGSIPMQSVITTAAIERTNLPTSCVTAHIDNHS